MTESISAINHTMNFLMDSTRNNRLQEKSIIVKIIFDVASTHLSIYLTQIRISNTFLQCNSFSDLLLSQFVMQCVSSAS